MFNGLCCLLCLESSSDQIEFDGKDGHGLNSREVIELHFKQELLMMSQIEAKAVCRKCWQLVQSFHEFYLHVQQVHKEAAITLKNIRTGKESVEIKDEFIKEIPTPTRRRRGRPIRNEPQDHTAASCDTALLLSSPLNECQVKIEELLKPDSTNANDSCDDVLPTTLINDPSLEDGCVDTSVLAAAATESEEMESEDEDLRVVRKLKRTNKKTAESDAYIAKKNFKFSCSICHIPLANFKGLRTHFRIQHKTKGFVLCCGKKLCERSVLIDHIHFHEDPDYFKCKDCGKTMSERRSLELHLQYKHGSREPVHQCSICSKGFFRASCLKQHYNTHVTDDEKTVPCSKCTRRFPSHVELGKHMRHTHLNAYAKICDICGILVKGRPAFERHQAEHSGVPRKLIKCDLCDAALTTKYGLARHIKTMHTQEYQTPQVCPHCSRVSPSLQAHKNHIKYMHSLQRKHICKLCNKSFKRLTDFKEHMATHTGEMLYTCSFCPQTFKSNANMYSHRKKKHSKEWAELCELKKSSAISAKEALSFEQQRN